MRTILINVLKTLGMYCLVALIAAGMLMLFAGLVPKTPVGWITIFLVALPIWLAFDWLGERIFSDKISRRLDASDSALSFRRMMYVFAVIIITSTAAAVILKLTQDFWGSHFSTLWR